MCCCSLRCILSSAASDFLVRNLAVLVQHGLRQQVLVGLLQPPVDLVEADAAARFCSAKIAWKMRREGNVSMVS